MPYINQESREELDEAIETMVEFITHGNDLSDYELLQITGELNYIFSRIIAGCMGEASYTKIATITGLMENMKQEFYRRVASTYEDRKILANGDIKEYRKV
jgi:hypothetical protein